MRPVESVTKKNSRKLRTRCLDLPARWKRYDRFTMAHDGTQMLRIGDLAQLIGVHTQTIRNYEQQCLIKPTTRSEVGHRFYDQGVVAQLQFIKRANLAGLTLAEVKELLSLTAESEEGENVPHVKEVLEEKLREAERTIEEISAFRDCLLSYRGWFEEKEDHGQR